MKSTKQLIGSFVAALLLCLGVSTSAHAVTITGSISLKGDFAANAANLNVATALSTMDGGEVSDDPRGTFDVAGIIDQSLRDTQLGYTPLIVNSPFISFDFDGRTYSFTLDSITDLVTTEDLITFYGTGVVSITGFEDTVGEWIFAASRELIYPPGTGNAHGYWFADFNASGIAATPESVPDYSHTLSLLGLSFIGMLALRRRTLLA